VFLEELAVVLLLLPFLLVMAGVGAAMVLWFVASAAVISATWRGGVG